MLKNLVFKDQPWGKCRSCKWSMDMERFKCNCPAIHITNIICLLKGILVCIENLDDIDNSAGSGGCSEDDTSF